MSQTKSKKVFYPFCTFFASFLSNEQKSSEKCQKGHKSFVNLLMLNEAISIHWWIGITWRMLCETFHKQRTADRFQVPSSKFLLPPSLPSPSIWVYHLAIPPSSLILPLQSFIPLFISIYSISLQFFTISFFAMSTKLSTQGSLSQFCAL